MSELLVRPTNPLHRSLKASSVRAPHDRRSSEGATFPKDILDLLATYFENVKEVRNMKGKLPDASTIAEHNLHVQEVLTCAANLRKASAAVFNSSELTLYQSHVALAVTSDVGRMVYETRLTISPSHVSQFLAYSATKPPPLALARKLKSVFEKMQRLKGSIEQTSEMAEDVERLHLAPVRCDTYYTATDIGALLTDIDNQFVLVQRMIVYLKGEVARLESKDRSDSTEKASGENGEEDGDLQFALKGMKISAQSDNDAHLLDRYNEVPQCSTPIVTRSTARLNSTASSSANADTLPNKSSFSASASQNTMRFVKPRRATTTVWDSLRAGVKQAKRPNYSFELFEQMTDACEEASTTATMSAHKRDMSFRQFSSMYRHLRGSHHTSETHDELVQEAAAVAVAQYASPVKKIQASQHKTPQSEMRVQNVPFVTSPTWQLAANSPGDWRHIRAYAATSEAPAPLSVSTKAPAESAVGFGKDYNSPLVGLVDYISKYAERQPKLPPAPLTVSTTQPLTSHALTALNTNTESLGMRRERGSNLTESPKSRSASKDFTKPTFAPSLGVFGSSPTGANSGSGGKDSTLNPHTSPSATKKVLKPSTVAPTLLTPGATTAQTASPTAAGAIASPIVAAPLTVPEIGKQLHEIYAKYVPEKLSDVPKLLAKYAGREKELLEKAIKKYGHVAPLASPGRAAHKSSPGGPPGSPLGTRPRPSGSIVDSDDQPRSRSASVASAASAGAGGALSGVPKSIFGGGGKPISTGFGAATVGATTAPPSGSLFGGNTAAGAGSLFKPAGAAASAEVTASGATPGASIFGAAPAAGAGSLFAKPSAAATVAPAIGATSTDPKQQILQRVTEIYTQHNPSKLSEIPQLLEKYKDRELQLIANLEKKYNVPHVPLTSSVPAAAPVSAGGTSVFGSGAAATGATSIFGKGAGSAQPSTGFGAGAAGAAGGGGSLFGKPSASATPTPFGNNSIAAGGSAGVGGTASPFGNTGSAGIPSPFGNTASPFGNASAAVPNTTATSGTGSLFGKPGPTASTGFGTSTAPQGGSGTGGLFGGGSAGVGGTSSPFTGAQNNTTGNLGTTGGLFGSSAGVAGNASPFANKNTATGGLFATPAAASGSPFNSGFNTPLGKTATPGASIFHQQSQAQTGGLGMGGMSMGLGGSAGIGGTVSPGLFNRPTTATPGNSLFGGNTSGGAVSTGFGNTAGGGSLFGGGNAASSAPVNSLSNINQIQQRVQAIYSQHNPSKLSEIPQLMEKYRGRELQLIANLEKKYNIDSSNAGQGNNNMMGGAQPGGGFGAFGGNNAAHSGTSTGFGQASQMGGTGGLFGAQGGMTMGNNNPSTGFGGMNMGQNNNNSNITTSPGGSSLFGRPAGAATGFGNTGMNASMNNNMSSGATPTGFGAPAGAASSVFGSTTRLGGNNPSTGFGNVGSMGGGGLFGGGGGGNSMWGNR